ncbi:MAG: SMC-Scp complex subunit ScpB [Myxococcota bacterium]
MAVKETTQDLEQADSSTDELAHAAAASVVVAAALAAGAELPPPEVVVQEPAPASDDEGPAAPDEPAPDDDATEPSNPIPEPIPAEPSMIEDPGAAVIFAAAVAVGAELPPRESAVPVVEVVPPVEEVAPAPVEETETKGRKKKKGKKGAAAETPPAPTENGAATTTETAPEPLASESVVEEQPAAEAQEPQASEPVVEEQPGAEAQEPGAEAAPPAEPDADDDEEDTNKPVGPPPDETLDQFLDRITPVVEGLIFAADHPLTIKEIIATLTAEAEVQASVENLETVLSRVQARYAQGAGITLQEVANGYAFRTAPAAARYLQRANQEKPFKMGRAALETLAIVAYRQPVTKPQIDELRGVDSSGALKALLDRNLVKILGKAEEVGRPLLYGTSKTFLEAFNLKMLSDLPTLREYHELTAENQAKVDAQAPKQEIGRIRDLARPDARLVSEEVEQEGSQAMEELDRAIGDANVSTRTAEVLLKAGGKLPPGMKLEHITGTPQPAAAEPEGEVGPEPEPEPEPSRDEEDTDATSASEEN